MKLLVIHQMTILAAASFIQEQEDSLPIKNFPFGRVTPVRFIICGIDSRESRVAMGCPDRFVSRTNVF
jgi:hypothetical protein